MLMFILGIIGLIFIVTIISMLGDLENTIMQCVLGILFMMVLYALVTGAVDFTFWLGYQIGPVYAILIMVILVVGGISIFIYLADKGWPENTLSGKPRTKNNKKNSPIKSKNKSPAKNYSKSNKKRLDAKWKKCPSCGHRLNRVAKKCSYCGFQLKKQTIPYSNKNKEKPLKSNKKGQSNYDMFKNEFGTKKCPKCNKEIIATAVKCKYCKYQFKKNHDKKENASSVRKKRKSNYDRLKDKQGTKKCPKCNKEIIATAVRCKYCKHSFNKEIYEYKKCPFCEKIILKSDRKCKHCKRAL